MKSRVYYNIIRRIPPEIETLVHRTTDIAAFSEYYTLHSWHPQTLLSCVVVVRSWHDRLLYCLYVSISSWPPGCRALWRPRRSRTRWARTPRGTGPGWTRTADTSEHSHSILIDIYCIIPLFIHIRHCGTAYCRASLTLPQAPSPMTTSFLCTGAAIT